MAVTNIGIVFTTSDGQQFASRGEATKHQARLDSIKEFADGLVEAFDLDPIVAVNVTVFLAERPETLMKLIGKTLRKPKGEDGTSEPADAQTDEETNTANANHEG